MEDSHEQPVGQSKTDEIDERINKRDGSNRQTAVSLVAAAFCFLPVGLQHIEKTEPDHNGNTQIND